MRPFAASGAASLRLAVAAASLRLAVAAASVRVAVAAPLMPRLRWSRHCVPESKLVCGGIKLPWLGVQLHKQP